MAESTELAVAIGVELAVVCQEDGVLLASDDFLDLAFVIESLEHALIQVAFGLHLLREGLVVLVALRTMECRDDALVPMPVLDDE